MYGATIDDGLLAELNSWQREVLEPLVTAVPRWEKTADQIGPAPTWRHTLYDTDAWLATPADHASPTG